MTASHFNPFCDSRSARANAAIVFVPFAQVPFEEYLSCLCVLSQSVPDSRQ